MMKKILCMGALNVDLTMFTKELPKPGETVLTDNFNQYPGGKGGNQSAALALLGGNVKYFTIMGDDAFSNMLIKKQKDYGVDTSSIIIEKGSTSGVAMIMVDSHAQNSILFTAGANSHLTSEIVKQNEKVFDGCDILEITMEIPIDACFEAIKIAKSKGMIVVLDPAPAPVGGIPSNIAKLIDFSKPNETEAEILTGIKVTDKESAKKALIALNKLGIRTPIVSLGKMGSLIYNEGKFDFYPIVDMNSIDTTAAGDIFLAAFTQALSEGKEIPKCMKFANVVAGISTTRKGAQTSIPTLKEINEILEKIG